MKRGFLAGLCVFGAAACVVAFASIGGAQTGDARSIEGQTGIDREHGFRITLPEGWQFDPIPGIHPCFSFSRGSDPNQRGSISASTRLDNATARQELDGWLASAQDLMVPGEPYEVSPIIENRLGGEEAVSCMEMFEDSRGVVQSGNIFAVRGDNSYHLLVSAPADQFDALQADVEFIKTNLRFD